MGGRTSLIMLAVLVVVQSSGSSAGSNLQALVGRAGRVELSAGRERICQFEAGLFNAQWVSASATSDPDPSGSDSVQRLRLAIPGGGDIAGEARITSASGKLEAQYTFVPHQDVTLNSLHVAATFDIATLAGGTWQADGREGTFPKDFGETQLFNGSIRRLQIELTNGIRFEFSFPQPTPVLLQDNRQWGPSFVIRMHRSSSSQSPFLKEVPVKVSFALSAPAGVDVIRDNPVTIVAGQDWIPLQLDLDIIPGTALDFSAMGLQDAPAGKHGWLQAKTDGTLVFEQQPDKPVRFYGVNLCFSAHYLPHDQADRLADRLARLGYNTVRLHHYEGELTEPSSGRPASGRTELNATKLDQLDYLVAALIQRGIYVTTDLFVSRPVDVTDLAPEATGIQRDAMNAFKVLAVINPAAYENWKEFARQLLTHVNPYTGRSYAAEPALAWLSLINEGNLGNYLPLIREIPDYRQAWNQWLQDRYRDREGLAAAWGDSLQSDEDPLQGTVSLEGAGNDWGRRGSDRTEFLTHLERDFLVRASKFLQEELGVRALITNMNAWTNPLTTQLVRSEMDYVDDHFYVDHPEFIERPWRLPSRCPNSSPVAGGASGGRTVTFTRLFDKPFTVSEYNFSGPGRYRGVGGILTGAMGAIQDWGAIWRFAYSHNREDITRPGRLDYFNMASDPLSQAAERASICLFLRGDMQPAPHSVTIAMTEQDLTRPEQPVPSLAPRWHWAAWVTRVGTSLVADPAKPQPQDIVLPLGWATPATAYTQSRFVGGRNPYQMNSDDIVSLLREQQILSRQNRTDPARNVFQCETGEITIDAPRDVMVLDTPRTAGGFAPAGETIETTHGVQVAVQDTEATVWVSALDDLPITQSRRMLVTHLTDLQNTGIQYAERARQTLLQWGELPHLVRAGKAEVRLRVDQPSDYQVWALATSGKRLDVVPARVSEGQLVFTADVGAWEPHGAVLCYEVARR